MGAAGRPDHHRRGPQLFVADLAHPGLDADAHHHLGTVRRVRPGDEVVLCDGAGSWRTARFGDDLEPTSEITTTERPNPALTVAMAPVKSDRTATAVQKLTELGVDRIVLVECSRSVVRWEGPRGDKAVERLRAVARSAAAQSRRLWLPAVEGPRGVAELWAWPGVAVADGGGGPLDPGTTTVIVGPEGGWAGTECPAGVPRLGLGPSVLRTETAAIAAGVLLTARRAGVVRSHAE